MDVKQYFAKNLRGVKILSQADYEKPVFFDNPKLLRVSAIPALVWKVKCGKLVQVPLTLYTIEYSGQFLAEYESEEHAISEIKELAKAAQNGAHGIFKFSWECELANIDKIKTRKAR